MNPREIVLAQLKHQATQPVPYVLDFEGNVGERLDEHYGGKAWRERLVPYIVCCGGLDRRKGEQISDSRRRDVYGSVWRIDKRPFHLVEPGLKTPSFDGYEFPPPETFIPPDMKGNTIKNLREHADSFTTISMGWGLWESCWGIRGFENALMDSAAEPEFFAELLDRLTDSYLAQLEHCADIPADAIFFGDDWGDQRGLMVGPERWREFFKPRYARIYEAAHAQGKLAITHCCGSLVDIIPDLIEIGLDAIESVQPEARDRHPVRGLANLQRRGARRRAAAEYRSRSAHLAVVGEQRWTCCDDVVEEDQFRNRPVR